MMSTSTAKADVVAGFSRTGLLVLALATQVAPAAAQQTAPLKGTLERITVRGRALEGNLEGDSPDRPVVVYLPPSYTRGTTRRYPVLYFLHGYAATAEAYVKSLAKDGEIQPPSPPGGSRTRRW